MYNKYIRAYCGGVALDSRRQRVIFSAFLQLARSEIQSFPR